MSENIKIRDHPTEEEGYIIPKHYTEGKFQLIDIMEESLSLEAFSGWCKGIILKYIIRTDSKNNLRNFTKAKYYLDELISFRNEKEKIAEEHIKPSYYNSTSIETIEVIEDKLPEEELLGFYQGMVIRYITRSSYKGHFLDDLVKAKYYLDRLIEHLKNK